MNRSEISDRGGLHPRGRSARLNTRELLVCAVFGAITAMAAMVLSQPLALTAAASPPLYALLGGYAAIMLLLALRMIDKPGAATVTALCASIVAWPFSPLGMLLLIAYVGPALMMDLAHLALRRRAPRAVLWVAAAAGAVTIFALSIPVFSPEHLTATILALTFVFRLVSYAISCTLALLLHRMLSRVGVRTRSSARAPGPTAAAQATVVPDVDARTTSSGRNRTV